ncbi:fatty acid desaturase family protein [Aliterella atlantica]|uniref:fatty acid desaturase family protein n=1 Tax=Aliterella atlantica TaxID=1827278 RepID=UPI000697D41C|nr:fatty acid desaturase [Aliterella atlantica]
MIMHVVKRPTIPAEFYRPSLLGTTVLIAYAFCLYIVPAYLSYLIAKSFNFLLLQIVLIIPLTIIAGYGLQLLGFIGHEGFHLSLHRNKLVSVVLGLFVASSVVTYFDTGAMMRHWSHHRFTNQPSDPDIQILAPLKTWWQRLFFARFLLNFHHIRTTINTALGRPWPFPYMMPFELRTVRVLCWINFGFALFWGGIYIAVILYDPLAGLFSIALPLLVLLIISGSQSYIDHGDTSHDPNDIFHNSWNRTSLLATALWFGANYHLEHHLYPGVPCYRLPKLHKLLQEKGIYEHVKLLTESSFFSAYSRLDADYTAGNKNSSFDPLKIAVESATNI